MLAKVGAGLDVHLISLQILATCVDEGISTAELMTKIAAESQYLEKPGVTARIAIEIVDGELATKKPGRCHPQETVNAIQAPKPAGKTQKVIYEVLGLSRSTVGRICKTLK